MKKISILILGSAALLMLPFLHSTAQNIIPIPKEMAALSGETFVWSQCGGISADASLGKEVAYLTRMVNARTGYNLTTSTSGSCLISLGIDATLSDPEAYTLQVTSSGIQIKGKTATGVFWGITTLEQLMNGDGTAITCTTTPGIKISDAPRTHVRELMVDPARRFIPFPDLKKFVSEMARYKLNSLHLHLSDDQGWRIEIKAYPLLAQEGSSRDKMDDILEPVSGYYTQDQMRELVAYADSFHVIIVPEIEMPGHSVAAIHCYPFLTCNETIVPIRTTSGVSNDLLCPSDERTYTFLGQVFRELASIFTAPYVHMGGDEAGNPALGKWSSCPRCTALKTAKGFTANWQLQEYMFNRMIDTLHVLGKTPMFWYETDFKTIPTGCVTFAWRHGLSQAAINAAVANNAKIMLCPGEHCYFDYPAKSGNMPEVNWGMPIISVQQAYKLDPAWGNGASFEQNNLFGVAGTLWGECINSTDRIYYAAYPRALALAEAGWSPQANRSWEGFLTRLLPLIKDMQRRGIACYIPSEYTDIQ